MMHLYSALCIAVHPKHFTIMWGGGVCCGAVPSAQTTVLQFYSTSVLTAPSVALFIIRNCLLLLIIEISEAVLYVSWNANLMFFILAEQ